MTLIRHELRQSKNSFIIWTAAVAFLMVVCILLFPEMKGQMSGVGDMFSTMGAFSEAFGMDRINFGTLIGFYAVECGNILGLGGAFFAALCGMSALAKEETERTAEFLFMHPVSRHRVITEKLAAIMIQILLLNGIVWGISVAAIAVIGEPVPWKEICLLHLAYFLLQIELAGICFGISAFSRRGSLGVGLGIAVMLYFLNIIANLTKAAAWLKYLTPFGYAEGADIVTDGKLNLLRVLLGMLYGVIGIVVAYGHYSRKDIR